MAKLFIIFITMGFNLYSSDNFENLKKEYFGEFNDQAFWNRILDKETITTEDLQGISERCGSELCKDSKGNTLVHYLAAKGETEKIRYLNKNNFSIYSTNNRSLNPVQMAELFNQEKCFKDLQQMEGIYYIDALEEPRIRQKRPKCNIM